MPPPNIVSGHKELNTPVNFQFQTQAGEALFVSTHYKVFYLKCKHPAYWNTNYTKKQSSTDEKLVQYTKPVKCSAYANHIGASNQILDGGNAWEWG